MNADVEPAVGPAWGLRRCVAETWHMFGLVTLFKLLLGLGSSSYRSTDFEVHRNWLAITHSLPLREWYHEATSPWTLDYPPLFAWFEWCLSHIAAFFDPEMLVVTNLGYASFGTILFQRLSVIAADAVFYLGIMMYCSTWSRATTVEVRSSHSKVCIVTTIALCNPGLMFVDHIHFQYNGFLIGLLLVSVGLIRRKRDLEAGAVFTVLLMFKHIFAYAAPVYFVYLLRHYCFQPRLTSRPRSSSAHVVARTLHRRKRLGSEPEMEARLSVTRKFQLSKLLKMAAVVLLIVAISFGPFLVHGPAAELKQIMSRLFPWGRGLTHAYWAPNVWAMYNGIDKAASVGLRLASSAFGLPLPFSLAAATNSTASSFTAGLVGDTASHVVLPAIRPIATAMFTLIAMTPSLVDLWQMPHPQAFCPALVFCMLSSFMLGWHVHEKAILMALIPMSMMACDSGADGRLYFFLSCVAHVSLFPLLFKPAEEPTLVLLTITYGLLTFALLDYFHRLQQLERHISPTGVSANFFSLGLDLLGSSGSDNDVTGKNLMTETEGEGDDDAGGGASEDLREACGNGAQPAARAPAVRRRNPRRGGGGGGGGRGGSGDSDEAGTESTGGEDGYEEDDDDSSGGDGRGSGSGRSRDSGGSGSGSGSLNLGKAPGVHARAVERLYILGLIGVHLYNSLAHKLLFGDRLPFLPLMLYSLYCAVGVTYCWVCAMVQHRARLRRIRTYLDD